MRRRDFIVALGGAAASSVSWPLAAHAQQREQVRRVGVLLPAAADNPEYQARVGAFLEGLAQLNWTDGRNVRLEFRWGGHADDIRRNVAELVALAPDAILATSSPVVGALRQATRTVPIVFVSVADPVEAGFVTGLARPGGNITGFINFENSMSGKWLELLKEIAPRVTRVAVLRDPAISSGAGQLAAIQMGAPSFGVELSPVNVRDASELERAVTAFARTANGGMIATGSPFIVGHRKLIISLAAQNRLPAVYSNLVNVTDGGLASYGPDRTDQYRRAASYVDRILKGEKPGDLPVQAPVKYELGINLKTAKALGLTVPPTLLARADEVIE